MPQSEFWPFGRNKVVEDDKSNEDASLLVCNLYLLCICNCNEIRFYSVIYECR